MKDVAAQLARFATGGAAFFVLNQLVLYVCTDGLHLHYVVSAVVSLCIVQVCAFVVHRTITFRSDGDIRRQAPAFGLAAAASFCLGLGLMDVLVRHAGLHYLLANAIAAGLLLGLNFVVMRCWIFRPR